MDIRDDWLTGLQWVNQNEGIRTPWLFWGRKEGHVELKRNVDTAVALRMLSVLIAILACVNVQASAQNGSQPMQHTAHDWVVVNEFGNSKCFIDKSRMEKQGEIVRVLVMYSLSPPGTDKRNNKPIAAMLNIEQYDLRARSFRLEQIVFQYTDGTESEPLRTDLEWKPATGGNQRTLEFLQGLK